ncbi:MAG: DUF547 domain-containing protein [Gemmatimonadaceae bacterium]
MRKVAALAGLATLVWGAQAASQTGKPPARQPKAAASAVVDADTLDPVAPSIDHSAYEALLHKYVANGLVNYAAFHDNPLFEKYLATLNVIDPSKFDEPERIAFWLNVYNAYTIELIASHGETKSIRNINKTFGVLRLKGPWSEAIVKAAGKTMTLDDVEHRILRHEFSEPRVHFAMSFGTLGGPPLRNEAYSGAKLEEQLEDQARIFIRESPKKNSVDTSRYTLYASPILARYRSDFGESSSALGKFLSDYYPDGPERRMLRPREVIVRRMQGEPGGGRGNVNAPVIVNAKADSTKPAAPPPQRQFRSFFRIVETPFDWGLNIQTGGKP